MEEIKIENLRIGQRVIIDAGIGRIEGICTLELRNRDYGDDYCITVNVDGEYRDCIINEIKLLD